MARRDLRAAGIVVALSVATAACGGGSGGVNIAPTPPPAPASYTKLVDMTGDRTFKTGGVSYNNDTNNVLSNGTVLNSGSGVTVAYTASNDTYTLTAPGGATASFSPANVVNPQPAPNALQWRVVNGTSSDVLTLIVPSNGSGVPLSYTLIGAWNRYTPTGSTNYLAVGGSPTLVSDMPKTGTANYNMGLGGNANSNGTIYNLNGNSTATFSANFGTGQITTALTLAGTPLGGAGVTPLGIFNGTGTITSGGPGFSGTLTGTPGNGIFSGAFFGPQALEVGFTYFISGTNFSAVGAGGGTKQ